MLRIAVHRLIVSKRQSLKPRTLWFCNIHISCRLSETVCNLCLTEFVLVYVRNLSFIPECYRLPFASGKHLNLSRVE